MHLLLRQAARRASRARCWWSENALSLRSKTAWESRFSKESFRSCGKQLAAQVGLAAGAWQLPVATLQNRYAALPIPRCICSCGKQLAAQVGLAAGVVATACHCAPNRYAALPIPRCICSCGKQLAAQAGPSQSVILYGKLDVRQRSAGSCA
jgi:hypothetical protein